MALSTLADAAEQIRRRALSPVVLLRDCLDAIEKLNPVLNAFITVTADSALEDAKRAEAEIQEGRWHGPLHGIPIGLKDLIDTAGVRTTAASAVWRDRIPPEDAQVVKKLKSAGALLIGKQNLHEFAYGGSSLISHFGAVRNPVNPEFITGGSSGGSTASVGAGMCCGAIGTDTAGSIREPAALCGLVGFKPSYGLVSARGVIPLSVSLDHVGPITRTVEDAAILLDGIAELAGNYQNNLREPLGKLVLGIPRKYFFENLDPEIGEAVEGAIADFKTLGLTIREIELPVSEDRTLQMAEAYAFHRDMVASSADLYDPETVRRVRAGEKITPEQCERARKELERERLAIGELLSGVDAFVTPTTPIPAPRIADLMRDPAQLRPAELLLLRNTRPINVWGLPAISIPCGTNSAGLPIGLQIVGPPNGDAGVLQIAHAYERAAHAKR